MIKLNIKYRLGFDVNRIKETIEKIHWFIENGYDYKKWIFPTSLDLEKLKDYSDDDILNAVEAEYSEEKYREHEQFINKNWLKYSEIYKKNLEGNAVLLHPEYHIFLTKYGTGGSYILPNKIINNISFHYNLGLIKTIFHEMTHLIIEKWAVSYKIKQQEKERLVDLILKKALPDMFEERDIKNIENVNISFEKNYPDLEKVVKDI